MSQRTYEIIIKNESGGEVAQSVGGTGNGNGKPKSGNGKSSAMQTMGKVFSYHTAKSMVMPIIAYNVSTVKLTTGSTEAQQQTNFWYNMSTRAVNVVESTVAGAMAGNVAGAVIGLVVGVTREAIDVGLAQQRLNTQASIENVTRDTTAMRATYSGSRYQTVAQE
jgi:hypothetical protein